jgi:hypothetical protein
MCDENSDSTMPSISGTVTARLGFDGPLTFQLNQLCESLLVALCHDVPPRTRTRYVASVALVAESFREIGFPLPIFVELMELSRALKELDRGTVRDFLKPSKAHSHATDSSDVWQARAQVAIAIEQMMAGGLSRREASRRIARLFPQLRALCASKSKNFASAVGDWHIRLSKGEVKDDVATHTWGDRGALVAHYRAILDRAGAPSPSPLQIAFLLARGMLPLAGLARGTAKRETDRSQNMLSEERIEREFTRSIDAAKR